MEENTFETSWKDKAISRSVRIKEQNKVIKVLKDSRENWKHKYSLQKLETLKYKNELEAIKKTMQKYL